LLIQHGAEVDFQENEDGIPLRSAAVAGHYAVVRQLIAAGADKSVVDTEMVGAVEVASGGHIKCLAALLDYGVDANVSNNTGNALGWASLNGHLETCRLLLDRGADIN
ncbi:ankyrin, partial [Canariomyces notabilis]